MPDLNEPFVREIGRVHFFMGVIVWRIFGIDQWDDGESSYNPGLGLGDGVAVWLSVGVADGVLVLDGVLGIRFTASGS